MAAAMTWAAAGLSLIWALVHLVVGGKEVARPLCGARDLAPSVRAVSWMCWHYTSLTLVAVAGLFAGAAILPSRELLATATLLSAGLAAIGFIAARRFGQPLSAVPQGLLFLPTTGLGGAALLQG